MNQETPQTLKPELLGLANSKVIEPIHPPQVVPLVEIQGKSLNNVLPNLNINPTDAAFMFGAMAIYFVGYYWSRQKY